LVVTFVIFCTAGFAIGVNRQGGSGLPRGSAVGLLQELPGGYYFDPSIRAEAAKILIPSDEVFGVADHDALAGTSALVSTSITRVTACPAWPTGSLP
jgi:hypothetical protein